jgi:retinol dehydrogenase-12
MAQEFPIKPETGKFVRTFFRSQLLVTPPYPDQSFENQVVIVTGSNVGLGREAARHFYRLNAAKLILAVRTVSKGEAAKEDIAQSVKHRTDAANAIEVWPLDLTSTDSTLAFANRVIKELARLDIVVENAGVNNRQWYTSEGFEQTIQINVLNTFLLALSVLPKLLESKNRFTDSAPHLVIVSSEAHHMTKFDEINAVDIYERLNTDEKNYNGLERYSVSKLIEVLFIRELVHRLEPNWPSAPPVIIDMVNPGMCYSDIGRDVTAAQRFIFSFVRPLLARPTEVGSRTFVHAAAASQDSHGQFMSDGKNQEVAKWINEDVGKKAQIKVFEQTMKILEKRNPGIAKAIGL